MALCGSARVLHRRLQVRAPGPVRDGAARNSWLRGHAWACYLHGVVLWRIGRSCRQILASPDACFTGSRLQGGVCVCACVCVRSRLAEGVA